LAYAGVGVAGSRVRALGYGGGAREGDGRWSGRA
jgi:hypothetical protein